MTLQSVAVVIPTVGRSSLSPAVKSALRQARAVDEVIIVDNSPNGVDHLLPRDPRVRRVRPTTSAVGENSPTSPSARNPAMNRNLGVLSTDCDVVAFLDDDDAWLPSKIADQMAVLERSSSSVVSCRVRYVSGSRGSRIRPKEPLHPGLRILEGLYGTRRWKPSPVYVATPTLMCSRELLLANPFDEEMPAYEDTWWLHCAEERGARLIQVPQVGCIVQGNPRRSIARDSLQDNVTWARQLATVDHRYAYNFLTGISIRSAIVRSRFDEVHQLLEAAVPYRSIGKDRASVITALAKLARISVAERSPRNVPSDRAE